MSTETVEKDSKNYPILRNLQYSPLKQGEEQYIVLWDPTGLSAEKLVLPLNFFYLFQFFDGEHSLEQVGAEYLKKYGEFMMPDRLNKLVEDLETKMFLEGERAAEAQRQALENYRKQDARPMAFAGKQYEADPVKLRAQLDGFYQSKEGPEKAPSENAGKLIRGLVAPNFDMKEAGPIYAWGYKELREGHTPDVFIVIGTCHAGLEGGIVFTDKDFDTPFGRVAVNRPLVDFIRKESGDTFFQEELVHIREHSLELQLPFLQHALGEERAFTILPVLCSFPPATLTGGEYHGLFERVDQFLSVTKRAIEASGQQVCIIASANLAHIGIRYGDQKPPTDFSFHRCMQTDLEMLKKVEEADPEGFAEFILKEGDQRKIMGFSAIFSLLKLMKRDETPLKGQVLRYDRGITDQFNSTVTYASIVFV
ncbi:MAG: AmmeMemoRadiSam system protein B [Nitrospirales bacterium]